MLPVFIAGYSRSGTTLITRLFDGHPQMLAFFGETFLFLNHDWIHVLPDPEQRFLHFTGRPYDFKLGKLEPRRNTIRREDSWEKHKFWEDVCDRAEDISAVETKLKHALESGNILLRFNTLCDIQQSLFWASSEPPRYIVEKTPRNEFYLDEIFALNPDARIVHMVRDPFDFLASRWKSRNRTRRDRTFANDVMGWKTSLHRGLAMKRRRPENYCFIRFDELVLNTEDVNRRPRRYRPPANTLGDSLSRMQLMLRVLRFGPRRPVPPVDFV